MKITKLTHSCLLVQVDDKKLIVDPGIYSWKSGLIDQDILEDVDYVVITHVHADHCDDNFIQAINAHSPNARWYSTNEVAKKLSGFNITVQTKSDDIGIRFIQSDHADLSPWMSEQPEHVSFVLFDELLIGGDCHTLTESYGARIFGGAINGGPWGGVVGFVKMIEAMNDRPKLVVPLHDWHFHQEAATAIYERLPMVLGQLDVGFVDLKDGLLTEV